MDGPVKWVRQEDAFGCGVACMAMLMGCSYAEAKARYCAIYPNREALTTSGITGWEVDAVTAAYGLARARGWKWVAESRGLPWPPPPSAFADLVMVVLPAGAHFIVRLPDGRVLDPARPGVWTLDDFADVMEVCAIVPAPPAHAAQ